MLDLRLASGSERIYRGGHLHGVLIEHGGVMEYNNTVCIIVDLTFTIERSTFIKVMSRPSHASRLDHRNGTSCMGVYS